MSDVKFDIWDEQESELTVEIEEERKGFKEWELETNVEYTQHPLFVSILNLVKWYLICITNLI